MDKMSLTLEDVENKIRSGELREIEEALFQLLTLPLELKIKNTVSQNIQRCRSLKLAQGRGIIDNKEYSLERNNICSAIFDLLYEIQHRPETSRASEINEKVLNVPEKASELYSKSIDLYNKNGLNNLKKAANLLTQAIGLYNNYGDAYYLRAMCKEEMGGFEDAMFDYGVSLGNNVTNPDGVYFCMANNFRHQGQKSNALKCIEKIKNPISFQPHLNNLLREIYNLK